MIEYILLHLIQLIIQLIVIYPKFEQKWPGKYLKVVDVGILRAYNFGLSSELNSLAYELAWWWYKLWNVARHIADVAELRNEVHATVKSEENALRQMNLKMFQSSWRKCANHVWNIPDVLFRFLWFQKQFIFKGNVLFQMLQHMLTLRVSKKIEIIV